MLCHVRSGFMNREPVQVLGSRAGQRPTAYGLLRLRASSVSGRCPTGRWPTGFAARRPPEPMQTRCITIHWWPCLHAFGLRRFDAWAFAYADAVDAGYDRGAGPNPCAEFRRQALSALSALAAELRDNAFQGLDDFLLVHLRLLELELQAEGFCGWPVGKNEGLRAAWLWFGGHLSNLLAGDCRASAIPRQLFDEGDHFL